MKWLFAFSLVAVFYCYTTQNADAIIFLPAIVLIPIAKFIALIIGGFSFPVVGIGALWSKLFGKSLKRTIFICVLLLLLLAVIITIILKVHDPSRPWL